MSDSIPGPTAPWSRQTVRFEIRGGRPIPGNRGRIWKGGDCSDNLDTFGPRPRRIMGSELIRAVRAAWNIGSRAPGHQLGNAVQDAGRRCCNIPRLPACRNSTT